MGESEGFDLVVADDQTSYGYPAYIDGFLSDCNSAAQNPTDGVVSIKQTTPPCLADCNCDTKVNLADLVIMKGEFLQSCPCQADCNGDNQVNLSDLVIMKAQFLRSDCPDCAYLRCMEECESELELCLIDCEGWSPDSRYICNDNCVFNYSSNCVTACD